jgi:GT2 family glycosyltransferase
MQNSVEFIIPAKDPSPNFRGLLTAWLDQEISENWSITYCIVDDGSSDGYIERIVEGLEGHYRILRNKVSLGRSGAVNIGINSSLADYVIILDSDCRPESQRTLSYIIESFAGGADLVFGKLTSEGGGFWSRYFEGVANGREREFLAGNKAAFTTQYCGVKKSIFKVAGLFCEQYSHYGFEDRDLILRLHAVCEKIVYAPNSIVYHDDSPTLEGVCLKMYVAGKFSAPIFKDQHPDAYKGMLYSYVDYENLNGVGKIVANALADRREMLSRLGLFILSPKSPYVLKKVYVKFISGVYFFAGTRQGVCDRGEVKNP